MYWAFDHYQSLQMSLDGTFPGSSRMNPYVLDCFFPLAP